MNLVPWRLLIACNVAVMDFGGHVHTMLLLTMRADFMAVSRRYNRAEQKAGTDVGGVVVHLLGLSM